jgi:hypothetical protein
MIGPKNLRSIREDLRRALAGNGRNPIRELEQRLSAHNSSGIAPVGSCEVVESLKRFLFLHEPNTSGRRRKSVAKKTGTALVR